MRSAQAAVHADLPKVTFSTTITLIVLEKVTFFHNLCTEVLEKVPASVSSGNPPANLRRLSGNLHQLSANVARAALSIDDP